MNHHHKSSKSTHAPAQTRSRKVQKAAQASKAKEVQKAAQAGRGKKPSKANKPSKPKKVEKDAQASKAKKSSKRKKVKARISQKRVRGFVNELFGPTEHAKRVQSLANAVVGITQMAVLAIHAIGQAYAQVAGISGKSGVKQVDRLLSNHNFVLARVLETWVGFVVGARKQVVIALDWTEFDDDKHSTLAAYLVTNHGRATPLAWHTHAKATLKGNQKRYEYELIEQLHRWIDPHVEVTLLADRGFGDQKLYDYLIMLGWDFIIRFRGGIAVTAADEKDKKIL